MGEWALVLQWPGCPVSSTCSLSPLSQVGQGILPIHHGPCVCSVGEAGPVRQMGWVSSLFTMGLVCTVRAAWPSVASA